MFNLMIEDPRMFMADDGAGAGGDAGAGDDAAAAAAAGAGDDAGAGTGAGGGEESPYSWMGEGELSEESKAYLDTKKYKSPHDLLKALNGAEKLIGGDKMARPPSDPEKMAEWFAENNLGEAFGIPESADDYQLEQPAFDDSVKDYMTYDDTIHKAVIGKMHSLNVPPAAAKELVNFFVEQQTMIAKNTVQAAIDDEAELNTGLKKDWGDQFEQRQNAGFEVAKEMGLTPEAIESLRLGNIAGSSTMTKILYELAVARGNDTLKGGKNSGVKSDPDQAKKDLDAFKAKHGEALTNKKHSEHDLRVREWNDLRKAAGRGSA